MSDPSAPKLYDISITVNRDTPEWPGDTPFSSQWHASISSGSSVNVSVFNGSPHVGTHADAALHVRDGWPGSHELPLSAFCGPAIVVDVGGDARSISTEELEGVLPELRDRVARSGRLLLKTGRTTAAGEFPEEWPTLSEDCARTLLGSGLILLGVDCPSVDPRESKSLAVHNMLFSGNACLLENLDLRRVPTGEYELFAFPMKVMGMDAAPVRAVLRSL